MRKGDQASALGTLLGAVRRVDTTVENPGRYRQPRRELETQAPVITGGGKAILLQRHDDALAMRDEEQRRSSVRTLSLAMGALAQPRLRRSYCF